MDHKPPPFDAGRAWTDAMTLLRSGREALLTLSGFFFVLPMLALLFVRWPIIESGSSARQFESWYEANSLWLLIVQLAAAYGRLAILRFLLDRQRPTVGEALAASAPALAWFYLLTVIVGLIESGGFFLFVLPGLYLLGRLFLAEVVFVAEGVKNPLRVIARSFVVTARNGWRLFGVMALIGIGAGIFMLATGTVLGVVAAVVGGQGLDRFVAALTVASVLAGVWLLYLLVAVAAWRQLGDQGNVRRSVAR